MIGMPLQAVMHTYARILVFPPKAAWAWSGERRKQAQPFLDPREVDDHFARSLVRNYCGGSSNATTHLLSTMHYRSMLRWLASAEFSYYSIITHFALATSGPFVASFSPQS
jgi:hypothetical protein